jgi:tRNA dimethylallyltransferase
LDLLDKKLIVIVGPTAVGKTGFAIKVAKHFKTEVISADSRQIFRELNIGTAKPTRSELEMVRHHFINSHSISEPFDAAIFGAEALILIEDLFKKHDHVILCGGSGLYVKAVCEGFDEIPRIAPEIREGLVVDYETNGIEALQSKLKQLDPDHFDNIDSKNPQRLIRALEVVLSTGKSITSFHSGNAIGRNFSIVKFGLTLPREILFKRIDERMDAMIADGLFDEARGLYPFRDHNALQTVGYREIFDFMDGNYDKEEAIRLLKRNSRRYAKRQLTWFRRDPEIVWMNPVNIEALIEACR